MMQAYPSEPAMKARIVGSKGAAGVAERIVSELPPHELYIEAFAGLAAVGRLKKPSTLAVFIDKDLRTASALRAMLARAPPGPLAGNGDAGSPAPNLARRACSVICGDATRLLTPERIPPAAVLYLDPPYLGSARRQSRRYYRCEQLTEAEHVHILDWACAFRCRVLISGYASELYADRLKSWRLVTFGAQTRGGPALEHLWCNFPEPDALHDTRFVGAGFRERERIKRKVSRWVSRLARLPRGERSAILAAFDEAAGPPGSSLAGSGERRR